MGITITLRKIHENGGNVDKKLRDLEKRVWSDVSLVDEYVEQKARIGQLEDLMDDFVIGYLNTALWAETDGERPLDENYSIGDFNEDAIKKSIKDCLKFKILNEVDLDIAEQGFSASRNGHDFWLSRNGHGAGFFARPDGFHSRRSIWKALQESAQKFGEVYILLENDGLGMH